MFDRQVVLHLTFTPAKSLFLSQLWTTMSKNKQKNYVLFCDQENITEFKIATTF